MSSSQHSHELGSTPDPSIPPPPITSLDTAERDAAEHDQAEHLQTEGDLAGGGSTGADVGQRFWPNSDETMVLIREAAAGDQAARGELLNRHRDPLRRMIDMRLDQRIRRRIDASDIVQNVLVSADRRLAEYFANPEVPFFIWLRQLARDNMIDAHRKHRVSQKRSVDREQTGRPATHRSSRGDLMALLADQNLTPAAAATFVEFKIQFERALDQLGETDREIMLMRHYEYLTNKEAALVLGITEHAASMRYVRALRSVGRQLRRLGFDD